MASSTVIILIILAIIVSILLNYKFKVNMGITGFLFAYVIGIFCMHMKATAVTNLWPAASFIQIMMILWFFGYAIENGTMNLIADNVLYAFRNIRWAIPYAVLLAGFAVGAFGAAPPAGVTICCVFAYGVAKQAGWHPMMLVPFAASSTMAGSLVPWGASGPIIVSFLQNNTAYGDYAFNWTWKILLYFTLTLVIFCTIYYVVFRGWKCTSGDFIQKPEKFNRNQKITLIAIVCFIVLLVVPSILKSIFGNLPLVSKISPFSDVRSLSMLGIFVLTILKASDARNVLTKSVPWGTLILIAGMGMLLNLAFEAGVQQMITDYLSGSVSAVMIAPLFAVMGGILSCFAGAINVVFPLLASMVPSLMEANPNLNPLLLFASIAIGASITGISPFSSGGAMTVAQAGEFGFDGSKITIYTLLSAIIGLALVFVLSLLGVYGL